MEWFEIFAIRVRNAKLFQGGVFGGGGEGEVGGVAAHFARGHRLQDEFLNIFGRFVHILPQRYIEVHGRFAPLRGVGFVDDDGKGAVRKIVDAIDDEGELLDGADDDLFAAFQMLFEVSRALGVGDDVFDFGEVADGVAQLAVEDAAVGGRR